MGIKKLNETENVIMRVLMKKLKSYRKHETYPEDFLDELEGEIALILITFESREEQDNGQ